MRPIDPGEHDAIRAIALSLQPIHDVIRSRRVCPDTACLDWSFIAPIVYQTGDGVLSVRFGITAHHVGVLVGEVDAIAEPGRPLRPLYSLIGGNFTHRRSADQRINLLAEFVETGERWFAAATTAHSQLLAESSGYARDPQLDTVTFHGAVSDPPRIRGIVPSR